MKKEASIHIGGLYVSKEPVVIRTVLGSCVAVCLFDPANQIGGMNHILLPGKADRKQIDNSARYGINAMELLINKIMKLGGRRYQLIAKVFGGAHVLPGISEENATGLKNVEFVLEFLEAESISIVSQNTGGYNTRRIYFHTDTGEVFLKRVRSIYYPKIATEEQKYLEYIKKEIKKPADVTLF